MPLDFVTIAARFAELAFQDRLATVAGRAIEAAVVRRGAEVQAAALRTRDMPMLRFEYGALAVLVSSSLVAAERNVLFAAGTELWRNVGGGWDRWWHAAGDLPAFVDAVEGLLATVEESIDRYASPSPAVFDPRGRTFFDLFGVGAAFFATMRRAVAPGGDIDQLLLVVIASAAILRTAPPVDSGAAGADGQASTPTAPAPDQLDAIVLAGALMFAALPRLMSILLAGIDVRVHLMTLDVLGTVEREARRSIAGAYEAVFTHLRAVGFLMLQLVRGIQRVVGGFARGAIAFVVGFGTEFGGAIKDFVFQLAQFLRVVVLLMELVVEALELIGLDRWVRSDIPIEPAAPPLVFRSNMPAFGQTLFGADVRQKVAGVIGAADEGIRTTLTAGFARAANELQGAARQFTDMFDASGPDTRLSRLPANADHLVGDLFPMESAPTQHDPIAEALESWLANGGVATLAAVLDGYAWHVAQQWHARYTAEPVPGGPEPGRTAPTSPHLLRRHATPTRVAVPRVLIRVGGPPDSDVLDAVATEFASAVRSAYRAGTQRSPAIKGGR